MPRFLISFDDGDMVIPEAELPRVDADSHQVVREAKQAGVWIFGGGIAQQPAGIVAPDATVTEGIYPEAKAVIGGFCILEVPTRDEALRWAAKFAAACRCAQQVRLIMHDPESL